MMEYERQVDRISDVVVAYDKMKSLFEAFIAAWHDRDKKMGVKAMKSRTGDLSLSLFDGRKVDVLFAMVINQRNDPWGKIVFTLADKEVSVIYFDTEGYLYDHPTHSNSDEIPPNLKHPLQQGRIVARFMDAYLELFREG